MRYGWQLKHEHWRKLSNNLVRRNWNRVTLLKREMNRVPEGSGVYLICSSPEHIPVSGEVMKRLYNVIYVGRAINLRQRFKNHANKPKSKIQIADDIFKKLDFWYVPIDSSETAEIEQIIISAFGPTANEINAIKARSLDPIPAG